MQKESFLNGLLALAFFLLPWQTRWMFGFHLLDGQTYEYGILSIYMVEMLVMGCFFLALLFKRFIIPDRFALPVILCLIAFGVSTFFSIDPVLSLGQCVHVFSAICLFFLLLQPWAKAPILLGSFLGGLIIPILLGFFQILTGSSPASSWLGLAFREAAHLGDSVLFAPDGTRILRAYGSFPHPNIFGGYLAVALFLFWKFGQDFFQSRWMRGIVFCFLGIGLVLTFSQSAWLSLVAGAIVLAGELFRNHKWSLMIFGIGIFLFITGTIFFLVTETQSSSQRIDQYHDWPTVIQDSWLVGSGMGSYPLALHVSFPSQDVWSYQPIHNVFFLVISDIGIFGFCCLILGLFLLKSKDFLREPIVFVFLPLLLFDHYLWSFWSGFALLALASGFVVKERQGKEVLDKENPMF
ncbi:MAG: O-antigen ligase family protein [Patescibacteria group bacterium]|jgi:hypothetical protein